VSRGTFQRILTQCLRAPLADEQLDALAIKHVGVGRADQVDYVGFVAAVEAASKAAHPAASVVGKEHLSEAEQARLGPLLERIRRLVTSQRTNMRPVLEDFDRTHEFHISAEQFLRVLTIFHLLPADAEAQQLLLKAYRPPNPLDARAYMVNYVRFLADVDPTYSLPRAETLHPLNHLRCISKKQQGRVLSNNSNDDEGDHSHGHSSNNNSLASLERRAQSATFLGGRDRPAGVLLREIKAYVLRTRTPLGEYLQEADRLRQGHITRSQLARGLSRAGVRLTDSEVQALADLYPLPAPAKVDAEGQSLVRYTLLLDEVGAVFTLKDLEKKPGVPAEEVSEGVGHAATRRHGEGTPCLH
jgi:hypothetical protein